MTKYGFSKILIVAVITGVLIIGAGVGYWLGRGAGTEGGEQQKANKDPQFDVPYIGGDFTIIPPAGWIQTQIPSTLVSYQNSKETQPKGSAAEKIKFKSYLAVSFDNVNSKTLNEIVEIVKRQLEGVAPAISFSSVVDGIIGGQPAKLIEADLFMQDIDFKVIMALAMKGDKYFTISNNTTAEKWPEYRDLFYNTLNSFKFKY